MVSPILPPLIPKRADSTLQRRRSLSSDLEDILLYQRSFVKQMEQARESERRAQIAQDMIRDNISTQAIAESQPGLSEQLSADLRNYIAAQTGEAGEFRPSPELVKRDMSILPQSLRDQTTNKELNQRQMSDTGLLGWILSKPGIGHAARALGVFSENVINPIAQELIAGTQGFIPGEQELERRMNEAEKAARAEGMGYIGRLRARHEAGREVDLPSGILSLPWEIPIPSFIAGPDKSLKDIQFGVRGLAETTVGLPFDVLAFKGLGKAVKAISKAKKLPQGKVVPQGQILPNSKEWLKMYRSASPEKKQRMNQYAAAYESKQAHVPLDKKGVPQGKVPSDLEGTSLGKVYAAFPDEALPAKPTWIERVKNLPLVFRQRVTDSNALSEKVSSTVRKNWRNDIGGELPDEMSAFAARSAYLGSNSAAHSRGLEVLQNVKSKLFDKFKQPLPFPDGKDGLYFVTAYLALKNGIGQIALHPGRAVVGEVVTGQGARAALKQMQKRLGEQGFKAVESAATVLRNHYRTQLDRKVAEGFVTRKVADEMVEALPWYNPIRYLNDYSEGLLPGETLGVAGYKGYAKAKPFQRLSEKGGAGAREDFVSTLFNDIYAAELSLARNSLTKATIKQSLLDAELGPMMKRYTPYRRVSGDKSPPKKTPHQVVDKLEYWENGEKLTWEVPRRLKQEIDGMELGYSQAGGLYDIGRKLNSIPRNLLVTYNPVFMASQSVFDMMTVAITHGVMPWESGMAMLRNLRSIVGGQVDPGLTRMMRAGADPMGWYGRSRSEIIKSAQKGQNLVLDSNKSWQALLGTASRRFGVIRDIGHALEMGPRRAVFEKALQRGSSEKVASALARRSTVDFNRGGDAVMAANNFYLFLNPAVQGTLIPMRALMEPLTQRYAMQGMGAYIAANYASYMWNRQFPEYYDIPMFERVGSISFMLPSNEVDPRTGNKKPHRITVVPNVREFAMLGTPLQMILGQLDERDPAGFNEMIRPLLDTLNPADSLGTVPTYLGSQFFDLLRNEDTFRGRPIVPADLENLDESEQYNEFTSEVAKRIGGAINWSPMKIDFLMRNGWVRDIFLMGDAVLRRVYNEEDIEIEGTAAFLKELADNYGKEEVDLFRKTIYGGLDKKQREALESAELKPEPTLPFVGTMINRFYKRYGAQVYKTGFGLAAKEAGISEDNMRYITNQLSEYGDLELGFQEERDDALAKGDMSGQEWRKGRRDAAKIFDGILLGLKAFMPKEADLLLNADTRAKFYDDVATMAGQIKDRRSEGELLLSIRRAIPLPRGPGNMEDWTAHFVLVDAFEFSLTPEQRQLLREYQEASATDKEREFIRQTKEFSFYWDVHERLLENDPDRIALYDEYMQADITGEARIELLEDYPWLGETERATSDIRRRLRMESEELDEFLFKWGYAGLVTDNNGIAVHTDLFNRRYEIAPWTLKREQALMASLQAQGGAAGG